MSTPASNIHSIQGEQSSGIPMFEGEEVPFSKARITSVSELELDDSAFRVDEIVRLVVECRVEGINHRVNKEGKLARVHTMKALDSYVIDWKLDLDKLREVLG